MHVAFVTPAWRRYAVTRLALAQRAHLRDELAARGVTATCIVVADDQNLDIAESFGFDTIEMSNEHLGAKVNAGFALAAQQEADYIAFIGSDDWMHIDLFEELGQNRVYAGHEITVIDLIYGVGKHLGWRGRFGVPPWFIPRGALERCSFQPCNPQATHGMEFEISCALNEAGVRWRFDDPHAMSRVDFKSDVGMTSYEQITRALAGDDFARPFRELDRWYPPRLTNMALETHHLFAEAVAA